MSVHGFETNAFKQSKKFPKSNPFRFSGPLKKTESEVFVGNLPPDITEVEIANLFQEFGLKAVRKRQNCSLRSFAFLELASPEAVQLAVQMRDGAFVNGQRMLVAVSGQRRSSESRRSYAEMPALEPVPNGLPVGNGDLIAKPSIQTEPSIQTVPHSTKKNAYAVLMEMRSSFLVPMLRDCFKDLGWLLTISRISGEAALLVTDTVPQTPFFWAIHLKEESHQNTQELFSSLAEAESQMPFLAKHEVQRGTRCMAECTLEEEGGAWNRCWVMDTVENLAVVFFMDFGCSATVPLNALRRLDKDHFWKIQPLAQPFMLHENLFPPQIMARQILEGSVVKSSQMENHILTFIAKTN